MVDWMNGFHAAISVIWLQVIHVFPGFHQYKAVALKCHAQGESQEKLRETSAS